MLSAEAVKEKAISLGFHKVGIVEILPTPSDAEQQAAESLQRWLQQGFQADMQWMHSPKRQNIRQIMPEAKSVICVALNYYSAQQRPEGQQYAKISRYGWGRDYHRVMTKKLKQLSAWLREQTTTDADGISAAVEARPYADTGPVQDKFWAEQAGIGWIAKNGNVITRQYGSWVFLGEVITTASLQPDQPHTRHCGTCTRCIEACPTEAIASPGVIDANRCIAYHTIENRADQLSEPVTANLNNWVAGCDICQDVCPWNQRFAQPTDVEAFEPYPANVAPMLAELAEITDEQWNERFPASALRRIKPAMLRRNAKAAMATNTDLGHQSHTLDRLDARARTNDDGERC
ncbi:MAG: tRNA epoxyqueuosine(34) reductase QueG [Cyanobacteria bacterium J06581_3]